MIANLRSRAFAVIAIGALCGLPTAALGQDDAALDGSLFVVTQDDTDVRSGAHASYYPFEQLEAGEIVLVVGELDGWAKVNTIGPAFSESFAYIKYSSSRSDRLEFDLEGLTATTLSRIDVIAPNARSENPNESWRTILRLPAGATVHVIETTRSERDVIHRIRVPEEAAGWIERRLLRPAGEAEMVAWQTALLDPVSETLESETLIVEAETADPAMGVILTPEGNPALVSVTTAVGGTTDSDPIDVDPVGIDTEMADAVLDTGMDRDPARIAADIEAIHETGAETPATDLEPAADDAIARADVAREATPADPKPVDIDAVMAETAETTDMVAIEAETLAIPEAALTERDELDQLAEELTLDRVETAFERLSKEDLATAEVDPLIALYEELLATTDSRREEAFCNARIKQLEIWRDLQARRSRIQEIRMRAEQQVTATYTATLEIDADREYSAVGRVLASTIYDGVSLPRLYRIQDAGSGRTVAYIRPNGEFDFTGMLGALVGVSGNQRYDGSLGLNLIAPTHVDILGN